MCGIFGAFQYQGKALKDLDDQLKKAAVLLHHRGPDDQGFYISEDRKAGLAHTRLSIIDIESGHQPMSNNDSSIWIAFNGEIFNYQSLRKDLIKQGHVFQTNSDTEVIVHLYEAHGYDCLDHLRGMFAFAVWDAEKETLFCARDRLGQKPFVYAVMDGNFYFCSEILPLIRLTPVSREISITALHHCFNVFLPVAPYSIFKEVKKLRPGSALIVNRSGIREYTYWTPKYVPKFMEDEMELTERLEFLLDESVRIRLMSEVPLGSMLSGGLDSSVVSFFAQKNSHHRLKTFGAFHREEKSRDLDWHYVKMAADAIGSEHHNIFYDETELLDRVPSMVAAFGEPYASINGPVSILLSEKIREHVTVALSGNGGDEVFAGYNTYRKVRFLNNGFVKTALKMPMECLMQRLAGKWDREDLDRCFAKWMWFYPLTLKKERRGGYIAAPFSSWIASNLFSEDCLGQAESPEALFQDLFEHAPADNPLDAWTYTDLMGRMQENMVCRSDATGMQPSLEIRAPLLDHKLVEFAARLPVHYRLKGSKHTKYLLSKVALKHFPASLIHRKKQGFSGVTYNRLIRCAQGPWKHHLENHLFGSGVLARTGLFKKQGVEKIWKGLSDSSTSLHVATRYFLLVWALVVFEVWYGMVCQDNGFASCSPGLCGEKNLFIR